jgi:hypothetical protein
MAEFLLLVPSAAATTLDTGGRWGEMSAQVSDPEQVARVVAISAESGPVMPVEGLDRSHFLNSANTKPIGRWFQVDPQTQVAWAVARSRASGITLTGFRNLVPKSLPNPGAFLFFVLTYAPDLPTELAEAGVPRLAGWMVRAEGVVPIAVDIEHADVGVHQLHGHWPIETLKNKRICIVGAGSIGSAAAHALALYGIGTLDLVDPDRLLRHNLVRHTSSTRQVGKLKVNALKQDLEQQRPDTRVMAQPLNVVDDANSIRELLASVDLLVCATDGVSSRRVAGHLARRARKDAILACVLEAGALGEVIRLRPWADRGCIVCCREYLQEAGAFNPEPGINRPYGEGTHHRPMTAVGADLHLVGQHAAKMAVATLLQANGCNDQRLPSDHLIIGLRPAPAWPAPYDVRRCGDTKWLPAAPPQPGCPTCDPPLGIANPSL